MSTLGDLSAHSCCDGYQFVQPPITYRQGRLLSDLSTLQNMWLPTSVTGGDDFKAYVYSDRNCYVFKTSDGASTSHGFIPSHYEWLSTSGEVTAVCVSVTTPPCPTLTGSVATIKSGCNLSGIPVQYTPSFQIDTATVSNFKISAMSTGIVVLIKDSDTITFSQTSSLQTWVLPNNHLILDSTSGTLLGKLCDALVKNVANSKSVSLTTGTGGTPGSTMPGGGFTVATFNSVIDVSTLVTAGLVSGGGIAHLRLAVIGVNDGSLSLDSFTCNVTEPPPPCTLESTMTGMAIGETRLTNNLMLSVFIAANPGDVTHPPGTITVCNALEAGTITWSGKTFTYYVDPLNRSDASLNPCGDGTGCLYYITRTA